MIPAWALRFLPHAIVIAAVLGAIWWIDHRGYARAQADVERERLITANMLLIAVRKSEGLIADRLRAIDTGLRDQIGAIDVHDRTIVQPVIEREIARDPRYTDPATGLSGELLDALNTGRAAGTCAARADGGIVCTLPRAVADPRPAVGPGDRDAR